MDERPDEQMEVYIQNAGLSRDGSHNSIDIFNIVSKDKVLIQSDIPYEEAIEIISERRYKFLGVTDG